MSQESMEWLNKYVLVGYTDKRGTTAWHYRSDLQDGESNHYPDAIPVDDVLRRLFDWEATESPIYVPKGKEFVVVPGRKAILTSDTGEVLGVFKDGYQMHQYKDWLLDNVGMILDDELGIGSAGLLKNRAQAFVSVEVPESIVTPEGVEFRPNLLASTSFDGTLATTYKRVVTIVVCDNTRDAALSESGQQFKVKHSRNSGMRIRDAREALAIVHTMGEDFAKEIKRLTSWKVTEKQFMQLLDLSVPVPEGEDAAKRGITMAENKRAKIINLYHNDERVAPWKGTAFGVAQAWNTYNTHDAQVRKGVPRFIRNMENVLADRMAAADNEVLEQLAVVTGKK